MYFIINEISHVLVGSHYSFLLTKGSGMVFFRFKSHFYNQGSHFSDYNLNFRQFCAYLAYFQTILCNLFLYKCKNSIYLVWDLSSIRKINQIILSMAGCSPDKVKFQNWIEFVFWLLFNVIWGHHWSMFEFRLLSGFEKLVPINLRFSSRVHVTIGVPESTQKNYRCTKITLVKLMLIEV